MWGCGWVDGVSLWGPYTVDGSGEYDIRTLTLLFMSCPMAQRLGFWTEDREIARLKPACGTMGNS